MSSVRMPPGDDRQSTASLEDGEVNLVHALEAMLFASGGKDVTEVDSFTGHPIKKRGAVVDQDERKTVDDAVDCSRTGLQEAKTDV